MMQCPCLSGDDYASCCEPMHTLHNADNGEKLMRSRYCAFYLGQQGIRTADMADYLVATSHPELVPRPTAIELLSSFTQSNWQGLQIIQHETSNSHSHVEFVALLQDNNGTIQQLHEDSEFIYDGSQWLYYKGQAMADYKFQRNQACWCASGKKYKQCHGK